MNPQTPLMQKLSNLALCRGLSEAQTAQIFEICEETELAPGSVLFREGDAGDALYGVLEGALEVTKSDGAGGQQALARMNGGAVLGEMSLLGPHTARSATATAVTKVTLLEISVDRFDALLKEDSLAALKVVHNLAQVMSKRLVLMNEKLVEAGRGRRKEELYDFQKILNDWSF
jgi:CRP/FNR family cyclic AMP-dependent transcriptional regulator